MMHAELNHLGKYELQIVPKYQSKIHGQDNQIIPMYAKGMSTRDITEHIESHKGVELSVDLIRRITDIARNQGIAESAFQAPVRMEGMVHQHIVMSAAYGSKEQKAASPC